MTKLTRAQRRDIRTALYSASSAYEYLAKPTTIVAMQRQVATTTLDFTLPDGRVACEVEKFIGSPLAMLVTAVQQLHRIIEEG